MKSTALVLLLLCAAVPAAADYSFQPLGTFGHLRTEPRDMDDAGRITGLLAGA